MKLSSLLLLSALALTLSSVASQQKIFTEEYQTWLNDHPKATDQQKQRVKWHYKRVNSLSGKANKYVKPLWKSKIITISVPVDNDKSGNSTEYKYNPCKNINLRFKLWNIYQSSNKRTPLQYKFNRHEWDYFIQTKFNCTIKN